MGYLNYVKERLKNKRVCIYPMGIAGKSILSKLEAHGIEIDFFSDKNEELWGSRFKGKECIPKAQLMNMPQDDLVVIIESLYYKEIKEDLSQCGIKNIMRIYPEKFETDVFVEKYGSILEEKVKAVLDICEDETSKKTFKHITDFWKRDDCPDNYFEPVYSKNQYFDTDIYTINDNEVFVDVGAYIGDTMEKFLHCCGTHFDKIHLFELDTHIYNRLNKNVQKLPIDVAKKIKCYPYGLSDENNQVYFVEGDSNSGISNEIGNVLGSVRRMDDVLKGERVTLIKMDIEGAEMAALRGAEQIIKEKKPKLAICIYHSPEDMLNIPIYLKHLIPEYKIYIRHYTDLMLETVCYAVPTERVSSYTTNQRSRV